MVNRNLFFIFVSVSVNQQIQDLANDIEYSFYKRGYKKELLTEIRKIEPDFSKDYLSNSELSEYLENLKG